MVNVGLVMVFAVYGLSLMGSAYIHGKPKTRKINNFWADLIGVVVQLGLFMLVAGWSFA